MPLIRNAKIQTKLIILAITTFILVLLVDMVAVLNINQLYARIEQFHTDNIVPLSLVSDMRGSFHGTRANIMDVILAEDEKNRTELIEGSNGLNESLAYFATAVRSYQSYINATDSALEGEAEAVTALVNALDSTQKVINQIITSPTQEEALALARGDFRDIAYNQILPNVQKLNAMHVNETASQMELSQNERNKGILLLLGLTVFNILAFALVGFIIIRSINLPLHEMIGVADHISSGNLHVNIGYRSKDELGILADRFRTMIATLEHLSGCVSEMGKIHDAGQWDFRIHTDSLSGAYQEIAESVNHNTDTIMQMMQDILGNMSDLANGKFNTVIKDYPGQKQQVADTMKILKDDLLSINQEAILLAQSGTSGNLSRRIDITRFHGDWRKVMESLNAFVDAVAQPLQEVSIALTQISQGNLSAQVHGRYEGDFASMQSSLNQTSRNLANYIGDISETVKQLADNNLDITIQREYIGDFAIIKDSLNDLTQKLNDTFREIAGSADQVLIAARQVSDSSADLSQGVSQQAEALDNVLADIAICAKQTNEDGQNAESARTISAQSKNDIAISNEKMQNMLQAMDGIREASGNISNIIKVIEDIALQTNLLALNAAVEAARAGQHGKGFSVVAEEVGNLATRSQKAASETTALIEDTIKRVNIGTDLANNTAASLEKMVGGIHSISDLMTLIEKSGQIQDEHFGLASTGLDQISQVVQNNSSTSEENAAASQEMSSQAEVLQNMIKVFNLRRE